MVKVLTSQDNGRGGAGLTPRYVYRQQLHDGQIFECCRVSTAQTRDRDQEGSQFEPHPVLEEPGVGQGTFAWQETTRAESAISTLSPLRLSLPAYDYQESLLEPGKAECPGCRSMRALEGMYQSTPSLRTSQPNQDTMNKRDA